MALIALLISHITIALGSLGYTAWVLVRPSRRGVSICYMLLGLTIASGTVLIIAKPAHMTEACITGLTYVLLMLGGILLAQRRLHAVVRPADTKPD